MDNSDLFGFKMTLNVQYFGRQYWIATKNEASRIRSLGFKSTGSPSLLAVCPGQAV